MSGRGGRQEEKVRRMGKSKLKIRNTVKWQKRVWKRLEEVLCEADFSSATTSPHKGTCILLSALLNGNRQDATHIFY